MTDQSNRDPGLFTPPTPAPPVWGPPGAFAPPPAAAPLWDPPAWSPPSSQSSAPPSFPCAAPDLASRSANGQKRHLLPVLCAVLVVLVLAVAGVTTYGIASTRHSASPSNRQAANSSHARVSSSPPTLAPQYGGETVVLWWVGAQNGILNIADDLINISRAGVKDDVGSLGTACIQLTADVHRLQIGPTPPAASVNDPFQSAMSDLEEAGTECTDGISSENSAELEQIQPEMEDASSQIQKMYASLDNYLPPGAVTEPSTPSFGSD
jgi:hypothetical protein